MTKRPPPKPAIVLAPITLEDLRHLFDLAVDTPLVCSGNFDTDDVNVLRRVAQLIDVDPTGITPDEFIRDYPHPFIPRPVRIDPLRTGEWVDRDGNVSEERPRDGWADFRMRDETDAERFARIAEERADLTCQAGTYERRCRRLHDDPKHT